MNLLLKIRFFLEETRLLPCYKLNAWLLCAPGELRVGFRCVGLFDMILFLWPPCKK